MRFVFRTRYEQDLRLFKDNGQKFCYGLLVAALLLAPWLFPDYFVSQLVFIWIYSVVGLGLMLLVGYTGQISMGHAAFLAMGAYTEAYLQSKGWPFVLSLASAAVVSGLTGIVVGLPALRVKGMYLAIATLAFGFIVCRTSALIMALSMLVTVSKTKSPPIIKTMDIKFISGNYRTKACLIQCIVLVYF